MAATDTHRLTQEIVDSLVVQRQELSRDGAGKATLEANRLAIVYWQQRLASALAAEHERAGGVRPARVGL